MARSPPVDRSRLLDDVVSSDDPAAQVRTLLQVWQDCRDPHLGELIERLSARLPTVPAPRTLTAQRELVATALARAAPSDVATVLALPWPGTGVRAWRHLRALSVLPPDPRVTTAVLRLLENFPYSGRVKQVLSAALVILERSGEARAARVWTEIGEPLRAQVPQWGLTAQAIRRLSGEPIRAKVRHDALTPEEAERLRPLSKRASPRVRDLDALYAEVYANPTRDEPREVLADALAEIGDPRGEFIQLQLQNARGAGTQQTRLRERRLLARHRAEWTLLRAIDSRTVEFERGFPSRASVTLQGRAASPAVMQDPRWATFVALDWPFSEGVNLEPLTSLEEVYLHGRRTTAGLPPNIRLLGEDNVGPLVHHAPASVHELSTRALEQPSLLPRRYRRLRLTSRPGASATQLLLHGLPASIQEVELALAPPGCGWARVGWGLLLRRRTDGFTAGRVVWHGSGGDDRLSDPTTWARRLPHCIRRITVPARYPQVQQALAVIRKDTQVELTEDVSG